MDFSALEQLGLNKSEIKTYFALLELETSTIGPIIDKAKVPDSKIYSILEKLSEKGLVSFVIKNNVKHFHASDPKNLLEIIKNKQETLKEQEHELLTSIIPQIEARRKLTNIKQEATVYESFKGIKAAFLYMLDQLSVGEEYQVLSFHEGLGTRKASNFFQEHHKRRNNKGIRFRLIAHEESRERMEQGHTYSLENTRYTTQRFPVGVYIFNKHTMTLIWGETPTAFVIQSEANYESYKRFFDELWEQAKT